MFILGFLTGLAYKMPKNLIKGLAEHMKLYSAKISKKCTKHSSQKCSLKCLKQDTIKSWHFFHKYTINVEKKNVQVMSKK